MKFANILGDKTSGSSPVARRDTYLHEGAAAAVQRKQPRIQGPHLCDARLMLCRDHALGLAGGPCEFTSGSTVDCGARGTHLRAKLWPHGSQSLSRRGSDSRSDVKVRARLEQNEGAPIDDHTKRLPVVAETSLDLHAPEFA